MKRANRLRAVMVAAFATLFIAIPWTTVAMAGTVGNIVSSLAETQAGTSEPAADTLGPSARATGAVADPTLPPESLVGRPGDADPANPLPAAAQGVAQGYRAEGDEAGLAYSLPGWDVCVSADASEYVWASVPQDFDIREYRGVIVVGIPVTFANTSDDIGDVYLGPHAVDIAVFDRCGAEECNNSSLAAYLDIGGEYPSYRDMGKLRGGASITAYVYVAFYGDGDYVIQFSYNYDVEGNYLGRYADDGTPNCKTVKIHLEKADIPSDVLDAGSDVVPSFHPFGNDVRQFDVEGCTLTVSNDPASQLWIAYPDDDSYTYPGKRVAWIPIALTNGTDRVIDARYWVNYLMFDPDGAQQEQNFSCMNWHMADRQGWHYVLPGGTVWGALAVAYSCDGVYDLWIDVAGNETFNDLVELPLHDPWEGAAAPMDVEYYCGGTGAALIDSQRAVSVGLAEAAYEVAEHGVVQLGQTLALGDWTVTFGDDPSAFVWSRYDDEDDSGLGYDGAWFFGVPATFTNNGDTPAAFDSSSALYWAETGIVWSQEIVPDGAEMRGYVPLLDDSAELVFANAGTSVEAYYYFPYVGDGVYRLILQDKQNYEGWTRLYDDDGAPTCYVVEIPVVGCEAAGIAGQVEAVDCSVELPEDVYAITLDSLYVEISLDPSTYRWEDVERTGYPFSGGSMFGVPVRVTNVGEKIQTRSWSPYATFGSNGLEQDDFAIFGPSNDWRRCLSIIDIDYYMPGGVATGYIWLVYDGDGVYTLLLRDYGTGSQTQLDIRIERK